MIVLYRIDNRLLHGQVLEGWIPYLNVNFVGVVSDEVKKDPDRQKLLILCAPRDLNLIFWNVEEAVSRIAALKEGGDQGVRALLLFSRPHAVNSLLDLGAPPPEEINIGGMHYAMGHLSLGRFTTFNEEDRTELLKLIQRGIRLDARATPYDKPVDLVSLLRA